MPDETAAASPASSPDALGPSTPPSGLPFVPVFETEGAPEAVGTLPAEQPEVDPELETGLTLWAVVFAGGIGSRFWPLSTPERPKQLLALVGARPLIAETVARLAPTVPADRVLVLTSADIVDALHAAIPEVPRTNMLVEPRPMGTAAALAWGAQEVARRVGAKTIICAMHADLAVGYPDELRRLLKRAAALAAADPVLVALGAEPTRPETGFGYMVPGAPLDPDAAAADAAGEPEPGDESSQRTIPRTAPYQVDRFVEKPGQYLAEELIAQGAFWHSGIVVARAGVVLEALAELTPELQPGLAALAAGKLDRFAGLIQSTSLERGLLERSHNVVVLPCDFGWDDVGTWAALRRVRELDDTGNGVWGAAHLVDSSSCVVHAEGGTVVGYGLSGMLVVSRPGLTFVTSLDRASELNPLLDALPESLAGRPRREPAAEASDNGTPRDAAEGDGENEGGGDGAAAS
jgi:mannose-1-phosphate guanylyltransferase